METFCTRLKALPRGYSEGRYRGRSWRAVLRVSEDARRWNLEAEALGLRDRVSFNLYLVDAGGPLLRPCEIPVQTALDFVAEYAPDPPQ